MTWTLENVTLPVKIIGSFAKLLISATSKGVNRRMRLFAKFMGLQSEEEDINMKMVEEERQRQETSIKLHQQPHTKKEVGLLNLNCFY